MSVMVINCILLDELGYRGTRPLQQAICTSAGQKNFSLAAPYAITLRRGFMYEVYVPHTPMSIGHISNNQGWQNMSTVPLRQCIQSLSNVLIYDSI
jgi:hypothetical protein